jgi:hypothetical protein
LNELAAKQEAFEEANRLKNQFRALDEDEVEFLDSVLESTRAEEDRVRRETAEGLELFRKQQEEADKKARTGSEGVSVAEEGSPTGEEEQWMAGGRKRKRAKEKEVLKGVKIRRSFSTNESTKPVSLSSSNESSSLTKEISKSAASPTQVQTDRVPPVTKLASPAIVVKIQRAPPKGGLGLVDYGSDEDD